jgi:ankyrin repeat protein
LDGGYFRKPTPLQLASYGTKTIQAVRTSDGELLKRMLECGISPNSCNAFGESFIHMVCRSGDYKLLKILLDAGCSLQVTNDFGRTPLHEACWTSAFDCVELILDTDVRLLHILDCRGSSPLSYVRQEHWKHWIEFFKSKADRYWAPRDLSVEGKEAPPPLAEAAPHSLPIPDPKNSIPVELATLISAGKLLPEEFLQRKEEVLPVRQVVTKVSMRERDEEGYFGL